MQIDSAAAVYRKLIQEFPEGSSYCSSRTVIGHIVNLKLMLSCIHVVYVCLVSVGWGKGKESQGNIT